MEPGKTYRMRQPGSPTFVDGFFKDHGFFEGRGDHCVGLVDADGDFIYRVLNPDQTSKYANHIAGKVEGLTLERVDGTCFELVEV